MSIRCFSDYLWQFHHHVLVPGSRISCLHIATGSLRGFCMRRDLEPHTHQIQNLIIHKNKILVVWRTTSAPALIMQSARNASNSRSLAERRLEDVAARQHFEVGVHGDRLLNPSSANPGMAAGRAGGRSDRRRNGTRLRAAPLRLELPIEDVSVGNEAFMSRTSQHIGTVLLMPMQHALSEDMRAWAAREGLMERSTWLPALLKPYLRLPLDRVSVKVCTASFEPSDAGILGPALPFLLLFRVLSFCFMVLIVDESGAPTNAFFCYDLQNSSFSFASTLSGAVSELTQYLHDSG
jgi:hypothetical protein